MINYRTNRYVYNILECCNTLSRQHECINDGGLETWSRLETSFCWSRSCLRSGNLGLGLNCAVKVLVSLSRPPGPNEASKFQLKKWMFSKWQNDVLLPLLGFRKYKVLVSVLISDSLGLGLGRGGLGLGRPGLGLRWSHFSLGLGLGHWVHHWSIPHPGYWFMLSFPITIKATHWLWVEIILVQFGHPYLPETMLIKHSFIFSNSKISKIGPCNLRLNHVHKVCHSTGPSYLSHIFHQIIFYRL